MMTKEGFAVGDEVLVIWGDYRAFGSVTAIGSAQAHPMSEPIHTYSIRLDDGQEQLALMPALWPWAAAAADRRAQLHFDVGRA